MRRLGATHTARAVRRIDGIGSSSGRGVVGGNDVFQVAAVGDGGAHGPTGLGGWEALVAVALLLLRARGF